jgi:DNA-binding transcriptional regulator GbsR (MarR family)
LPTRAAETGTGATSGNGTRPAQARPDQEPGPASDQRTPQAGRGQEPTPGSSQQAPPARPDQEPGPARSDRDPVAVRGFIERFTAQLTQAGFPRTPARIFVALLTSDSSTLTAAELAELLQTSPASISGGVRYLIQVGLVAAEGEPGSRRQHYWMSERVWQDIVRLRDRQFTRWAAELQDGVRILGTDSPAGIRMADTVRYFEFISAEMAGLLARWDSRNQAADSG